MSSSEASGGEGGSKKGSPPKRPTRNQSRRARANQNPVLETETTPRLSIPSPSQPVEESDDLARMQRQIQIEELREKLRQKLQNKLGLNFDQDVKTYKDVPGKRMETYRFRRVVSPSEFYLEFAHYPEPLSYRTWFKNMQDFYGIKENRDNLAVIHKIVLPGRCYVVREENKDELEWHRVRVHSVEKKDGKANVYFLDLCLKKQVKLTDLLELEPQFAAPAAQLFRAYLFDIRQKDGDWTPAMVEAFKDLVKGREFKGLVLSRSNDKITEGMPDFITTIGVALVENRKPKVKGICSLNAKMVDNGWAVAVGPFASCKHVVQLDGYVPAYQDIPPQVTDDDHVVVDEEKMMAETKDETEREEKILKMYYYNAPPCVPNDFSNSMANVDIVYIRSPAYIIVQQEYKEVELNAMNEEIEKLVAEEPPLTDGQPGTPVACCIQNKSESKDFSFWCRGVIITQTKDQKYRVLMVDHGSERNLDTKFVRPLPQKFQLIPSFAIRMHLDCETVFPVGSDGWGNAATGEFRQYLGQWDSECPRYFMFQHRNAETIELNQYAQTIMFTSEQKWKAGPDRANLKSYQAINHMKNHPLLYSLFHSVGADLHYEIYLAEQDNPYWYFKSVTDFLVEKKHAIKKESREMSAGEMHVATSHGHVM